MEFTMVNVGSVILSLFWLSNTDAFCGSFCHINHGYRCDSGIVSTVNARSVGECVTHCSMHETCHVINYRTSLQLCDLIDTNGAAIISTEEAGTLLVSMYDVVNEADKDVARQCRVGGAVEWQLVDGSRPPSSDVILLRENAYICQAQFGNALVPGTGYTSDPRCRFVYRSLANNVQRLRALSIPGENNFKPGWVNFTVGTSAPSNAFLGGYSEVGNPLYVCRAVINDAFHVGYYDHAGQEAAFAVSGSVYKPVEIQLLIMDPNGPTSGTRPAQFNCPRWHVSVAYTHFEWKYPGITNASGVVNTGWLNHVALSMNDGQTIGKVFRDSGNFIHKNVKTATSYPWVLCKIQPDAIIEWKSFSAGNPLPENVLPLAYTTENIPLYAMIYTPHQWGAVGHYDASTGQASHDYFGVNHVSAFDLMTIVYTGGAQAVDWNDEAFVAFGGPITAVRIQYDTTSIHGIQCQFGRQWSTGFWSMGNGQATVKMIMLKDGEYFESLRVIMGTSLDGIIFQTNLQSYGPYGKGSGSRELTLATQCGQIKHFSGQTVWDDALNRNISVMFAAHGQVCKWCQEMHPWRFVPNVPSCSST